MKREKVEEQWEGKDEELKNKKREENDSLTN